MSKELNSLPGTNVETTPELVTKYEKKLQRISNDTGDYTKT